MSDSEDVELFSENEEDNKDQQEIENLFSDDDGEDVQLQPVKKKQKRKQRANLFIEDEAIVDESDDEDVEDEEEGFEEPIEEIQIKGTHRKLDKRRQKEEEEDVHVIAARLKERHGGFRGEFRGDMEHIPQSLLIPSVNDPKLWLVRCKPGSEKCIVLGICRKMFKFDGHETHQLNLLSCFARDSLKGYIYLEAEKQAHAQHAIDKMNNVYATKLQLVPVNEMVDCLRARTKTHELKVGQWVRAKGRSIYAGDIGQILEVLDTGDSCLVKLIPRIDYSGNKRKKGDHRPPLKLFSQSDVANKREVTAVQGGYQYQGEFFDKDGYLEKPLKISALDYKNIVPTLDEITRFNDSVALLQENTPKGADFQTGEKVIILEGEMKNIFGVVFGVENSIVTIIPDSSFGLKNYVKYDASMLAKRFVEGDHAKVINGVHKGESGLVLKVSGNIVTILSDVNLNPIEIFSKDLRTASEVTSITQNTSLYELNDMVQLSPNEVGVIIKVEMDTFTLLDPYGNTKKVTVRQITNKRDTSRAVTSDVNGNPVTAKDLVLVLDSTNRKQAVVLHVFRQFCFLQSKELDAHVFVCKSSNVALVNNKGNQGIMQRPVGRPIGRRNHHLNAKTVTVTKGPFKGYLGIVKDSTDTHARVELHTNSRTISIEIDKLQIQGEQTTRPDYQQYSYDQARTPMQQGAKTPAWNQESRTPAWNAGSKTPAYNAGSKTPAWDSGSKTPAWDSGARTPAWDASTPYKRYTTPAMNTPYEEIQTPYNPNTPAFPATPRVAQTPKTPFDLPQTPAVIEPKPTSKFMPGILVKVIAGRGFEGGQYDAQIAKLVSIDPLNIELPNGELIEAEEEYLGPVSPQKRDQFMILSGEGRGKVGVLLSIDGQEGVVKVEGNDEILMMNLDTLAKTY